MVLFAALVSHGAITVYFLTSGAVLFSITAGLVFTCGGMGVFFCSLARLTFSGEIGASLSPSPYMVAAVMIKAKEIRTGPRRVGSFIKNKAQLGLINPTIR